MNDLSPTTSELAEQLVPASDAASSVIARRRADLEHVVKWLGGEIGAGSSVALRVLKAMTEAVQAESVVGDVPFSAYRDDAFPGENEPVPALGKRISWPDVMRWWDGRKDEYIRSLPQGARPLRPFSHKRGRLLVYGWREDVDTPDPTVQHLASSDISYRRTLVARTDVALIFRFLLLDGEVDMQSWRGWMVRTPFIVSVIFTTFATLLIIFIAALRPQAVVSPVGVTAILSTGFIWLWFVRPFLTLTRHRIAILDETSLWMGFGADPAQVELIRDGDGRLSRMDFVRYTAECPICAKQVRLSPGGREHGRHIVGRCMESPDEHVYSFDRWSKEGEALRARPAC